MNHCLPERLPLDGKVIVYGTTIGASAWAYFRGHLRHMAELGADVHLISSPGIHLSACGEREAVPVHEIEMAREISPISDIRAFVQWVRLLRSVKPDVVNVGTPKAALLGLAASWLVRTPVRVYTVRGLRFETSKGPLRLVLLLIEWLCCFLATDVVAVGVGVAKEMRARSLSPRPIVVIGEGSSNGIAAAEIALRSDEIDRASVRQEWGIDADCLVVGFVGRVTADKGAQVLADALTKLSGEANYDIRLLVVGEIEDERSSELLGSLPVLCHSTGWLEDTVPAFKAMDVLCLPSRREGFPNVVLEAGASGIPVVTTDATGAFESVVDGLTGLRVPIDDPTRLAVALNELLASSKRREELGAAGRRRAIDEYSPQRIWSALAVLYCGRYSDDIRRF